jgi:hypothetical protein
VQDADTPTRQPRAPVVAPPEHAVVLAPLNNIVETPRNVAVHERLEFGREVALEPDKSPQNTVTIILKSEGQIQEFVVHSDLLCYYSPYFHDKLGDQNAVIAKARIRSKMLRREWRWEHENDVDTMEGNGYGDIEGKIQIDVRIKFPGAVRQLHLDQDELGEVSLNVFAAFIDWLYKGFAGFGINRATQMHYDALTLIKLWVLAGKLGVPACQNNCIEGIELLRLKTNSIQPTALGWVYENTKEYQGECKLKKLLIDQCAWVLNGNWILSSGLLGEVQVPRQALVDILGRMRLMLTAGVKPTDEPPFARLDWRKRLYWIEDVEKNAG